MKIGVLSDTHLHRVTEEFAAICKSHLSEVDMILHAGDVVSAEVVTFLDHGVFHGVQGNMDPPEVRMLLPDKKIIRAGNYTIGLIHGWGRGDDLEDRILPMFPGVDLIVYGHSHIPSNHTREGVLLFNPGTATGYSSRGNHSLGILELGDEIRGKIITL
ncbi:MAG: YfcE family phosphodiesterase [Deltaproteobacteria bacterium]|nr:YfcE family phosphodiesterase [Deltaproteobacteria bacterium]MBW2047109.1 YfcE family phosphodiesterase [Deltaproteobacteria bacterium]MBW2109915.1 YfcE family phosphodiesterase [Deltaproteobacteria bacterium]MBW2351862.1 YfcE family phosphodiesterase [Deltaproteobacteria bacterium]HDZ89683.1 YfcE family phosphodiesterase [Deltaproteobacteria bacterium]